MGRLERSDWALDTNGWIDGEIEGQGGQGSQVLATFGSMGVWRTHEILRASNQHVYRITLTVCLDLRTFEKVIIKSLDQILD